MRLTHLLAGIVIAAGVVAGGTKAYVHYRVKASLDDLIRTARPFADISYTDLDTDLSGSATLHKLRILPRNFPDVFQFDAVTVSGPDMDFLLNGFNAPGQRGELPASAAIEIRGWHVRADSRLVHALRKSTARLSELLNIETDSCSFGQVFGAKDFAAIGQDSFLVDMRMGYRFAESYPGIELDWDYRAGGESGSFSMSLVDIGPSMNMASLKMPRLRDARISYRLDPAMTRKVVDHCAKLRGVEPGTYIDQLAAEPDVLYQVHLGFVPGPGLRQAFQDMLRDPGELQMTARPTDPLDLSTLNLYHTSQLPDLLGLTASVNGRPIDDLSLSFVDISAQLNEQMQEELGRSSFLNDLGIDSPAPPTTDPAPVTSARSIEPARYRGVDHTKLVDHVGRQVRIVGSGGRKRNGVLKSVERGIATVEERRHGGTLTSTIALREIVKAEAYH